MESGFAEFFQQLPPILPIALCGSLLLLVVIIVLVISARMRRSRQAYLTAAPMMMQSSAVGELPDLDMLLGNHAMPAEVVAPVAASPVAATPAPVSAPGSESVPQAAQRRNGTYTLELTNGRSVEATEVMSISRDMADGGLIIQIGDRAYSSAADIDNEAARRRFNATIRDLARQAMNADKKPGVDAAPLSAPRQQRAATPPPVSRSGAMPGDLPKFNTNETPLLAPRKRNQPPPPPVPDLNIADAIETYLQYKLAHTPEYEGRIIHVHASPGGGVAIEVDGQFYETVGEVSDADVRAFLASTIEEWQSRQ